MYPGTAFPLATIGECNWRQCTCAAAPRRNRAQAQLFVQSARNPRGPRHINTRTKHGLCKHTQGTQGAHNNAVQHRDFACQHSRCRTRDHNCTPLRGSKLPTAKPIAHHAQCCLEAQHYAGGGTERFQGSSDLAKADPTPSATAHSATTNQSHIPPARRPLQHSQPRV